MPASTPAPAAALTCVDRDAAVVKAVPAKLPKSLDPVNAESYILVELHPDSSIASTSLYRSSTNDDLDDAADSAANAGIYQAPLKNCVAYSSFVLMRIPFAGGTKTLTPTSPECAESAALLKSLARPAERGTKQRPAVAGSAVVEVAVDATGAVTGAKLLTKTGTEQLDAEAQRIATNSQYIPGQTSCKPVASTVKLELQFF